MYLQRASHINRKYQNSLGILKVSREISDGVWGNEGRGKREGKYSLKNSIITDPENVVTLNFNTTPS